MFFAFSIAKTSTKNVFSDSLERVFLCNVNKDIGHMDKRTGSCFRQACKLNSLSCSLVQMFMQLTVLGEVRIVRTTTATSVHTFKVQCA